MDAGQLFEQLQKKSNQNPNDIAVVLDAMITTIIGRIDENKSIEFADFGDFSTSEYGKITFNVAPEFAKIVNYRYNDMEAVPLSDAEESVFLDEPATDVQPEVPQDVMIDEEASTGFIQAEEPAPVHEEQLFIEDAETDTGFADLDQSSAEKIEDLTETESSISESVTEQDDNTISEFKNSDTVPEQKPENAVSSYVTEILDDIQSKPTEHSISETKIDSAPVNDKPDVKPMSSEPKPLVKKLDTVIEDSSLIVNVKEKETMQSHQSMGNSSPKSAEYDNNYGAGGLSNADLGGESDTKKWIIIISLIVVAIAVAIWLAFSADNKTSNTDAETSTTSDSVQTQQTIPAPVQEETKTPGKTTDKKAADTKTKNGKDAVKTPAKDTKTASKTTKPAPTPVKDASGAITVNYAALSGVSGGKEAIGAYTISVSSWSKKPAAEKEQAKWQNAGLTASVKEIYLVDKGGYWYRVQVGRYASRKAALTAVEEVKAEVPDAYVDTVE